MNTSSTATSCQNQRRAAPVVAPASRAIAKRRCATPNPPSASSAPTLTSTRSPYGLASRSSDPMRSSALTYPETATTRKQIRASDE